MNENLQSVKAASGTHSCGWAARISDGNGGKVSLGNYQDEGAAARAYDAAALKMHGAFATLNFPEVAR